MKEVRLRAPVSVERRLAWQAATDPEPSLFRMQFDWLGGTKSAWNIMFCNKIFDFLRLEWLRLRDEWNLDWYSDEHMRVMIQRKFEALSREWKNGQARQGETSE